MGQAQIKLWIRQWNNPIYMVSWTHFPLPLSATMLIEKEGIFSEMDLAKVFALRLKYF